MLMMIEMMNVMLPNVLVIHVNDDDDDRDDDRNDDDCNACPCLWLSTSNFSNLVHTLRQSSKNTTRTVAICADREYYHLGS